MMHTVKEAIFSQPTKENAVAMATRYLPNTQIARSRWRSPPPTHPVGDLEIVSSIWDQYTCSREGRPSRLQAGVNLQPSAQHTDLSQFMGGGEPQLTKDDPLAIVTVLTGNCLSQSKGSLAITRKVIPNYMNIFPHMN